MKEQDNVSEEIVIVGSRYGAFSDVVLPLFEKGDPIGEKDTENVLGFNKVVLFPEDDNRYDKYSVGVFTRDLKPLGHVWMCQAPALRRWLQENGRKHVSLRITRICAVAGVLMAVCETPMKLAETERNFFELDMQWAYNIPEVRSSKTEINLNLGLLLLNDELENTVTWTPVLQKRVDNLLQNLVMDLSGSLYRDNIDLYKRMSKSEDAEVRRQGELLLAAYVHRGSKDQLDWWMQNWLPEFFLSIRKQKLVEVYEAANFTLEKIEKILAKAPCGLFYIYKAQRENFAKRLYYAALPQDIYNRLLTLLAVREAMLMKEEASAEGAVNGKVDEDRSLVEKLKPLFYSNEANVRRFLKEIRGMATEDITDLVNRWVKEKLISDYGNSRKGVLWSILYEAGLYSKSKQNWCRRVE